MSDRRMAWLAWSLWALFVVLAAGLVLLAFLNRSPEAPAEAITSLLVTMFPTVGALVAARRPRNPIGWLILAVAASFVISSFAYQYAFYALITAPGALPAGRTMAWVETWSGLPGSSLILTFFFLLFPTGHLPSPRWRPIAWFAAVLVTVATLSAALTLGFTDRHGSPIVNPYGPASAATFLQGLDSLLRIIGIALGLICAASTLLRFRRARGDERQQLKWFVFAISLLALFFVANLVIDPNHTRNDALLTNVGDVVFGLVVSLPALAIGIAILKYRLYAIDLIIRRTLIYSLLTAVLASVYFVAIVLLQAVFRTLTGQGSTLAVVLSTLIIAALFGPLRRTAQGFIDRRFYRRKYDAARTLAAFSNTVRDEVELGRLAERLTEVVDETLQLVVTADINPNRTWRFTLSGTLHSVVMGEAVAITVEKTAANSFTASGLRSCFSANSQRRTNPVWIPNCDTPRSMLCVRSAIGSAVLA